MRRFRRLTALTLHLLLLQLALGGLAGACQEEGMAGRATAGAHQMAGGTHDAGAPAEGQPPCHEGRGHQHGGEHPCQMPAAGGSCATMASCTPPMLVARVSGTPTVRAHSAVPAGVQAIATGPSATPELPPPRA